MPRRHRHGLAAARDAAAATSQCLVYCDGRAVASRGSFKARVGRTSLERLFACCGPKGAAEACQLSQLAAGPRTAAMTLCSGSAPLRVRVLCELRPFVSAAPSSTDRSARPGSRNPMPGLQPRRTRGPWWGKGYTSSYAASGLETLAIAETEECAASLSLPSSFNSVSVTTELLTTGLVGPLRSLSANSREQEYEQAATSCSHCNSLIQHAPLRYR